MKKYSTVFELVGYIFLLLSEVLNNRNHKIIAAFISLASFIAALVMIVADMVSGSRLADEESGDDDLPDDLLFED